MLNTIGKLYYDFISIFFPNYCLGCQNALFQQEAWLCATCFADLPQTSYHLHDNNPIIQKLYGKVPATYAMSFYKLRKNGALQHLIHQLKYGNQPIIGELLGRMYGAQLAQRRWQKSFDCIVPVPLHQDRLRQRGYNQSDYFAKGIADLLAIPYYSQCIRRIRNTTTQTKKTKIERSQNLREAFVVVNASLIQAKHVLLVDDVITTGATLEACAGPLLAAGVGAVSVATICVTD